jgi:hypothetical protein
MMAYRYLRSALAEGLNCPDALEAAMSAVLSFISIDVGILVVSSLVKLFTDMSNYPGNARLHV